MCRGEGLRARQEVALDPESDRGGGRRGRILRPRGRPGQLSSASGLPPASARMRSRTSGSMRPRIEASSSVAASLVTQGPYDQVGQGGEGVVVGRLPHREGEGDPLRLQSTRDESQGLRRDLVEPLRVVDAAHHGVVLSGRRRGGSGRPAPPGTCRVVARRSPNAVRRASAWGGGSSSRRSSTGAHSWCNPPKAISISDSTPAARSTSQPAALGDVVQEHALADAGLSPQDHHRAAARTGSRDHLLEGATLDLPAHERIAVVCGPTHTSPARRASAVTDLRPCRAAPPGARADPYADETTRPTGWSPQASSVSSAARKSRDARCSCQSRSSSGLMGE